MKFSPRDNAASILMFGAALLLATVLYQPEAAANNVTASTAQTRVTESFNNALKAFRNNDFSRAYYWFNLLAEAGHAKAQSNLGLLFLRGRGVEQNTTTALRWFESAAQQGVVTAQFNLGYLYSTLKGKHRNFERAIHWYSKVAEQGHPTARFRLAMHYKRGVGVKANYVDSLRWALLALEVTKSETLRVKIRDFKDDLLENIPKSQIMKAVKIAKETTGA